METSDTDLLGGDSSEITPPSAAVESKSVRGGIVSGRGTANGLAIRLDGRVPREALIDALKEFLESRKGFLSGNDVFLEWVAVKPEEVLVDEIIKFLGDTFQVRVKSSAIREERKAVEASKGAASELPSLGANKSLSLFDGIEVLKIGAEEGAHPSPGFKQDAGGEAFLWDDPDARMFYGTLRSGQKIESEHSLVIIGDVNSGAELVAGGDIVVLGTLRGVAHAGAYDETGGGRFIFALNLKPTQLRIGSVISRGSSDSRAAAEIARIDGNNIVVEAYQARGVWGKK